MEDHLYHFFCNITTVLVWGLPRYQESTTLSKYSYNIHLSLFLFFLLFLVELILLFSHDWFLSSPSLLYTTSKSILKILLKIKNETNLFGKVWPRSSFWYLAYVKHVWKKVYYDALYRQYWWVTNVTATTVYFNTLLLGFLYTWILVNSETDSELISDIFHKELSK